MKKKNTFLRFSSSAIQMGVLITAGALGGQWLDERNNADFPFWTLGLTLFAVFAGLYIIIKEIIKLGKENEEEK